MVITEKSNDKDKPHWKNGPRKSTSVIGSLFDRICEKFPEVKENKKKSFIPDEDLRYVISEESWKKFHQEALPILRQYNQEFAQLLEFEKGEDPSIEKKLNRWIKMDSNTK